MRDHVPRDWKVQKYGVHFAWDDICKSVRHRIPMPHRHTVTQSVILQNVKNDKKDTDIFRLIDKYKLMASRNINSINFSI